MTSRLKPSKVYDEVADQKGPRTLVQCRPRRLVSVVSVGTEGWAGTLCTTTTVDWNCEGYGNPWARIRGGSSEVDSKICL